MNQKNAQMWLSRVEMEVYAAEFFLRKIMSKFFYCTNQLEMSKSGANLSSEVKFEIQKFAVSIDSYHKRKYSTLLRARKTLLRARHGEYFYQFLKFSNYFFTM